MMGKEAKSLCNTGTSSLWLLLLRSNMWFKFADKCIVRWFKRNQVFKFWNV